jgi:hypothetical protein
MANKSIVIDYDQVNYKEEIRQHVHNLPRYAREYVHDLFPIFQWIHKYNITVSTTAFSLFMALSVRVFFSNSLSL